MTDIIHKQTEVCFTEVTLKKLLKRQALLLKMMISLAGYFLAADLYANSTTIHLVQKQDFCGRCYGH